MSFFRSGEVTDSDYRILRDGDRNIIEEGREFVEAIWKECRAFVDQNLPEKARTSYAAAFWELYLAHSLLDAGISLVPRAEREPARHGPDLLARGPTVWLEASAPTSGKGRDAVPEPEFGTVRAVPDDEIILRYRQAISSKLDQLARHKDRGWVRPGDSVVIALSGARIPSARLEMTIPRIVRSVLPFGSESFHVDIDTMEVVDRTFGYRPAVEKRSGATVDVDLFLDEAHSGVSALLASCVDEINRPAVSGSDFVLIHNPLAEHPLPRGWLRVGEEYWVEDDNLHRNVHGAADS